MFYPNTEELRADEMRITALGTGLPTPLTRAQKSTSWMVELGNGDVIYQNQPLTVCQGCESEDLEALAEAEAQAAAQQELELQQDGAQQAAEQ